MKINSCHLILCIILTSMILPLSHVFGYNNKEEIIIVDNKTGNEWLSLKATVNMSYDQAEKKYAHKNFRHATIAEVGEFLQNGGFNFAPLTPGKDISVREDYFRSPTLITEFMTEYHRFMKMKIFAGITKDTAINLKDVDFHIDNNGHDYYKPMNTDQLPRTLMARKLLFKQVSESYTILNTDNNNYNWLYVVYIGSPDPLDRFTRLQDQVVNQACSTMQIINKNTSKLEIGHWLVRIKE